MPARCPSIFTGVWAGVVCRHRFLCPLFRLKIWERTPQKWTKKLISPEPRRRSSWFFSQKVDTNTAHVVNQSHTVWLACSVVYARTGVNFVKVQTGGKFDEDGHRDQISKQDSVCSDHGHVCTFFGGRGGWHGRVVRTHMQFWGGRLESCWWVYYHLAVVYQNRSFLFDSFHMGKGGECTFWNHAPPCRPSQKHGKHENLRFWCQRKDESEGSWSHPTSFPFVDGHLRLRTPYPVWSAKLSSLKLG